MPKSKNFVMASLPLLMGLGLMLASYSPASADQSPPAGNVIYQLTGQAVSSTYQQGTASFVAGSTATNLAFAFREDPAYLELSNITMTDQTTSSGNLVLNGDFSLGSGSAPTSWSYLNTFGASYGGHINSNCGYTGNNCYYDGAVGAYDAINQLIATTVGDTYQVSFYYADTNSGGTYQPTGSSVRDMYVYAGNSVPVAAPEPASLLLLCSGVAGIALLRQRRTRTG